MEVIPAIDVRSGRVVRLAQGDYARETDYALDPHALARAYADAGARWLHLVDLNGARDGTIGCESLIETIALTGLRIQAGGGVRGLDDVNRLLDAGATRVVVGSVAVEAPEKVEKWIWRFGRERLCIALDARRDAQGNWRLPVRGWTQVSQRTLESLVQRYVDAGARHLLCTDIGRDGMLSGPNLELYAQLRGMAPALDVIASGGVRDDADLNALRKRGVAAVVVGRSLLDGRLTVTRALVC